MAQECRETRTVTGSGKARRRPGPPSPKPSLGSEPGRKARGQRLQGREGGTPSMEREARPGALPRLAAPRAVERARRWAAVPARRLMLCGPEWAFPSRPQPSPPSSGHLGREDHRAPSSSDPRCQPHGRKPTLGPILLCSAATECGAALTASTGRLLGVCRRWARSRHSQCRSPRRPRTRPSLQGRTPRCRAAKPGVPVTSGERE